MKKSATPNQSVELTATRRAFTLSDDQNTFTSSYTRPRWRQFTSVSLDGNAHREIPAFSPLLLRGFLHDDHRVFGHWACAGCLSPLRRRLLARRICCWRSCMFLGRLSATCCSLAVCTLQDGSAIARTIGTGGIIVGAIFPGIFGLKIIPQFFRVAALQTSGMHVE